MIEINDFLEKNLTAIQIIIAEFGADKELVPMILSKSLQRNLNLIT